MIEVKADFGHQIENQRPGSSAGASAEGICGSEELAQLLRGEQIVLLDCRPSTETVPTFNRAQRVLLPTVLMRRLNNGTLATSSLSPQLNEPSSDLKVVIIPDQESSVASKVYSMLKKKEFDVKIFQDNLLDFARHFPSLIENPDKDYVDPANPGVLNFRIFTDKFAEKSMKSHQSSECFPAKIFQCVYLGNDATAKNKELLKRFDINYVINVTTDLPNYHESDPNFNYLRIPVDDSYAHNLAKYFPDAIQFIEKARAENAAVLVHCMAGISRSVTVCLAYLMYAMQCSLDDAFDKLLHQNASIQPNFHFMESLLCWEREIRQQIGHFVDGSSSHSSSLPSTGSSTASSACSSA